MGHSASNTHTQYQDACSSIHSTSMSQALVEAQRIQCQTERTKLPALTELTSW